jgi:hypothetical protein
MFFLNGNLLVILFFFFSLAAAATTKTTQKIETGNQKKNKIKLVEKCTQKRNNKF